MFLRLQGLGAGGPGPLGVQGFGELVCSPALLLHFAQAGWYWAASCGACAVPGAVLGCMGGLPTPGLSSHL
jgi:hypothetical protein